MMRSEEVSGRLRGRAPGRARPESIDENSEAPLVIEAPRPLSLPRERQASSPRRQSPRSRASSMSSRSRSSSSSSAPALSPGYKLSPASSVSSSATFIRHPSVSTSMSSSVFDSVSNWDDSWEMDESVGEYRDRVRQKVPPFYNGQHHIFILLVASLIGTIVPLAFWVADGGSISEFLLIVPFALTCCNIFEYLMHRFGGHSALASLIPLLKLVRFYHSVVHHTFFGGGATSDAELPDDVFFILFPRWVYMVWLLSSALPLLVAPASWLLVVACASYSLLQYELFHTFHHGALPPRVQAWLESIPALRAMKRRHRLHHSGACDTCFNITWPLADRFFGTFARGDGCCSPCA